MLTNQMGDIVVETQVSTNPARSLDFPIGAGADKWGLGFQLTALTMPDMRAPGSYSWAGINNTHFWGDPEREIETGLAPRLLALVMLLGGSALALQLDSRGIAAAGPQSWQVVGRSTVCSATPIPGSIQIREHRCVVGRRVAILLLAVLAIDPGQAGAARAAGH